MDLLFICRDATENSVIGNVGMAMRTQARGRQTAVLFTEEALAALAGEAFHWSPLFAARPARITISRNAAAPVAVPLLVDRLLRLETYDPFPIAPGCHCCPPSSHR